MRGCEVVVVAGSVCTALVGAMTAPWEVTLLVAPGFGLLVALAVAAMLPGFPATAAARRGVAFAAVGGVLFVPFLAGVAALGGAGGALFTALLVLGGLALGERIAQRAGAEPGSVPDPLEEAIPGLPTVCLLQEWHASEALLQSPENRRSAVRVRAVLLDELTRRDPAGVQDWLFSRDRSPEPHIRP